MACLPKRREQHTRHFPPEWLRIGHGALFCLPHGPRGYSPKQGLNLATCPRLTYVNHRVRSGSFAEIVHIKELSCYTSAAVARGGVALSACAVAIFGG